MLVKEVGKGKEVNNWLLEKAPFLIFVKEEPEGNCIEVNWFCVKALSPMLVKEVGKSREVNWFCEKALSPILVNVVGKVTAAKNLKEKALFPIFVTVCP